MNPFRNEADFSVSPADGKAAVQQIDWQSAPICNIIKNDSLHQENTFLQAG